MLRRFFPAAFLVPLLASAAAAFEPPTTCFTPNQDCEAVIVGEITAAQQQVLMQAFSFTSRSIGNALVAAHRRGVDVQLLVDGAQYASHPSEANWCARNGIPVAIDSPPGLHAHAHDKVEIIDAGLPRARVITGSYNPTHNAAVEDVDNLVILVNANVAASFFQHFAERAHASHPLGAQ